MNLYSLFDVRTERAHISVESSNRRSDSRVARGTVDDQIALYGVNKTAFHLHRTQGIIKAECHQVDNRPIVTTFSACYVQISIQLKTLLLDAEDDSGRPVIGSLQTAYKLFSLVSVCLYVLRDQRRNRF